MKFINFAVVKFSVMLTLGTITAYYFTLSFLLLYLLPVLLLLLGIIWFFSRKSLLQPVSFGGITYLCFFVIGYSSYQLRLPQFQKNHFTEYISENASDIIQLKVTEVLKPDLFHHKYIAEVIAVAGNPSNGKILLYLQKKNVAPVTINDVLLVTGTVQPLPKPLNPHQFDYGAYLKNLGAQYQLRLKKTDILITAKGTPTLRGRAEELRERVIKNLKKTPLTTDERAIVQALLLGQKRDISKEVYSDYAAAGAIHILAVSGLHVGILFFIFKFICSPLKRLPYGKFIEAAVIILCLFGFALLAGWSPSVVRAATMFSLFIFAEQLQRRTNSINTLFLSYLFLLLINPLWLFQVGFQLSYLAVFFILWIQPKLAAYYKPKTYVTRLLWGICTVTIAAQIGVLPLSLYYFHQFPGLFFISNLLILPFLGLLLGCGILVILLALAGMLPDWLALSYNSVLQFLNSSIKWVAAQEQFLFEDISFSAAKALSIYVFIIAFILLWKKYNYFKLIGVLASACIVMGVSIADTYNASENELVIFHKNRQTLMGVKQQNELMLLKTDTISYKSQFPVKDYKVAKNIQKITEKEVPAAFLYKEQLVFIIDSTAVYPAEKEVDLVVLTQSPRVHLERLIDSLQPQQIIADGSNYASYVARWEKTCKIKKLPFYHTGSEGAYIIK